MRAFVVHDSNGKIVSATIIPAEGDMQGEITPATHVGHHLTEVDVSHLLESERRIAKSENDAIARVLSRLMKG